MIGLRFLEAAENEFIAEVQFYKSVEARLGRRFRLAVATALACTFPNAGSSWKQGTRRVFANGFPFAVVYRVQPDEIVVVAIAHTSKRPRYWALRGKL